MKEIKITDIKGIQVGCAQDEVGGSGCTVVLCKQGAVAGVDVRGGGPATRETDLLNPYGAANSWCYAEWGKCVWFRCGKWGDAIFGRANMWI